MSLNRFSCTGNLTKQPDLRFTPKGTAVCEISVACNRTFVSDGEKRETCFYADITYFGPRAEVIGKHFDKGSPIYCESRLENQSWEDKQTGEKRYKIALIGEDFQFVGSKRDDATAARQSQPPARKQMPPRPPKDADLDAEDDQDIPF